MWPDSTGPIEEFEKVWKQLEGLQEQINTLQRQIQDIKDFEIRYQISQEVAADRTA